MGYIYRYTCSNCDNIEGGVAYGIGVLYAENNIDTRLFGCKDCGEVFSENINKTFIACPNCKEKSFELEFNDIEERKFNQKIKTKMNCPNCNEGTIEMEPIGLWD